MIDWLTGPHGDWSGTALALGIAVLAAYAAATLAVRLGCAALANFAFDDGTGDRRQHWQRPIRVARAVIFVVVLAALMLPEIGRAHV